MHLCSVKQTSNFSLKKKNINEIRSQNQISRCHPLAQYILSPPEFIVCSKLLNNFQQNK